MSLAVIPLAITMNAGPQIMSALIFVTANKPLKLSAYFLGGVVIAVTVGVTVTYTLANLLGNSVSLGDSSNSGSLGNIIQYLLVGLLIFQVAWRAAKRQTQDGVHYGTAAALGVPFRLGHPGDGRGEPRTARCLPSGSRAFYGRDRLYSGASGALLLAVPSSRQGGHAQGARLDEHEQLAGEHHRLRHLHRTHPRLRAFGEITDSGLLVDQHGDSEVVPDALRQQVPRDGQVACGIAHAR